MEEKITHNSLDSEKTEEVQNIIERIPTNFGFFVSSIVILLFILLLVFGWIVRYPDIVSAPISVNTIQTPIKLVSSTSGQLKLNGLKTEQVVKKGQVLAYINNSANFHDVFKLSKILRTVDVTRVDPIILYNALPKDLELGEINVKYFAFLNFLKQLGVSQKGELYRTQIGNLQTLIVEERKIFNNSLTRSVMALENLKVVEKFLKRDSTLFSKKVLTEAEFDKSKITFLNAKDSYQSALRDINSSREQLQLSESKVRELRVQNDDAERQLQFELLNGYNELQGQITTWQQRYIFTSPFSGKVQFLKFWNDNQFVQSGEQIFTVIPNENKILGYLFMPASGAGKVKKGFEVIVKLDDYPYMEYGSVTGKVRSISLTTNSVNTQNGDVETYLVTVDFPHRLITNYGSELPFRNDIKGLAEIITRDRRLIERLFDNLKYSINK